MADGEDSVKVAQSQKVFHFGSNLQKKGAKAILRALSKSKKLSEIKLPLSLLPLDPEKNEPMASESVWK